MSNNSSHHLTRLPVPKAYAPYESRDRQLIDVIIDHRARYDLLWFHWPRDGIFWWEDFEPIIYIYDDSGVLINLVVRRAWKYIPYDTDELSNPMEILFDSVQHHPFPKTYAGQEWFEDRKSMLTQLKIAPRLISTPDEIKPPCRYATLSSWNESIYDRIDRMVENLDG